MEAVILVGVQGSGKSTFYKERFVDTHIRLNFDMLRTRYREAVLLEACIRGKAKFIVDGTNPTPQERERYIQPAKAARFRVIGYLIEAPIEELKARNEQRPEARRIPIAGLLGTKKRLIEPRFEEGFDELYRVSAVGGQFVVERWDQEDRRDEVR